MAVKMPVATARDATPESAAVEQARAGDRSAFDWLVRTQGPWVRGLLFGVLGDADLAEDVAQITWTRAWTELAGLKEPSKWRPWLGRLARNAAIDTGRRRQRERLQRAGWPADVERVPATRPAADEQLEHRERQRAVMSAIRGLPAIYREPFVLRQLHDWSYAQIAEVLDLPPATVETRLTRARRLLREALVDWL
jgi:RNA polymerase sigma-70 factor (ECF subfamily)